MPFKSRKKKSRFFRDVPHQGIAPRWLQPARLQRNTVTARDWLKDRLKLDLNRPRPFGCVTDQDLRRLEPGMFLAWNMVQKRWEVWCRREEERRPPYFVVRVVSHPPNVHDEYGRVIKSCPGRPYRSRNAPSCPPSCNGVYAIPDRRLVKWLWQASLKNVGALEQADRMDRKDDAVDATLLRDAHNKIEALVSDNINQIAGIQQVGYTGKTYG